MVTIYWERHTLKTIWNCGLIHQARMPVKISHYFKKNAQCLNHTHTHTLTRFPGFKLQAQLSLRCIKIFWALTWYLLKKPRVILGFEKSTTPGKEKKKSHQSKHISSWILRSVFQRTFVKASKRPALAKTKQSLALLFLRMLYIELQGYYDANLKCTSFLLGHKHKTVYIVLSEEKVCC